ncbi:MAG: DNA-formamidopyrimidine glycosylase [Lentisphaerae bacterium]|nr:DNA-formamidopyrimidine glycosylase [Lentisphaerota bacterium]
MPELPEVETVVRELRALGLVGRVIRNARVFWRPMIAPLSPGAFAAQLKGRRIQTLSRRGKYIVLTLSGGGTLLIHLRMTGQLSISPRARRQPHEHVLLRLDDGCALRYRDTRKFGRWLLTAKPEVILGRLGPEPLSPHFNSKAFSAKLRGKRRQLKPLLLDQTFLAGLGNIYADEALWLSRLHPKRPAHTLSAAEARRLYQAICRTLRHGIKNMGTTLGRGRSNFRRPIGARGRNQEGLKVFRRTGLACLRCGGKIRRIVVSQRATHICPTCQARRPRWP